MNLRGYQHEIISSHNEETFLNIPCLLKVNIKVTHKYYYYYNPE